MPDFKLFEDLTGDLRGIDKDLQKIGEKVRAYEKAQGMERHALDATPQRPMPPPTPMDRFMERVKALPEPERLAFVLRERKRLPIHMPEAEYDLDKTLALAELIPAARDTTKTLPDLTIVGRGASARNEAEAERLMMRHCWTTNKKTPSLYAHAWCTNNLLLSGALPTHALNLPIGPALEAWAAAYEASDFKLYTGVGVIPREGVLAYFECLDKGVGSEYFVNPRRFLYKRVGQRKPEKADVALVMRWKRTALSNKRTVLF